MKLQTVVTGLGWMGSGVRSVKSALKEILRDAKNEILLCAYSVTGGADEILGEFEDCLKRGIKFKVVINRFYKQPQDIQEYFINLASTYPYCQVYDFNDAVEELHSKLIVVDRVVALIGSANLSMRGMKQNYELGIIIHDEEVRNIANCFDSLLSFPSVSLINTRFPCSQD
ncbi:MAG TPA: phospholipase D family protein [Oculatellaceae cyanobacterium]|jgi:phosphatidylserine/phosphatidylglycerophosphate/cardiolipin synthase-like enzyme